MEARRITFDSAEPTRNELGHVVAMIAQAGAKLNDTLKLMKAIPQDSLRFRRPEQESAEIEARYAQLTARKTALEEAIRHQVF